MNAECIQYVSVLMFMRLMFLAFYAVILKSSLAGLHFAHESLISSQAKSGLFV